MDTVASHGKCFSNVSVGQPSLTTTLQKRHVLGRTRVPLRRRVVRHHAVRICSQAGFGRGTVKVKEEEEEDEIIETEPSSGTKKVFKVPFPRKSPGTVKLQNKSQSQAKSNKVVFVAGATGKVGSRTVRELLKLGFSVRASTRNPEKAQALFEDVASSATGASESDNAALFGFFSPGKLFGFLKPKQGKKLEIVECNLEDPESIEPALGNAGVVVCCIGASEKEVLDVTGPYRIDFKATENLINAASSAEVNHFVLLTSLGTQKFGFPAAVLNLFWGVLLWKAKAEKALLQSGLPYTIVRPGGMERPTDAYKETHNLILAEADKLYGGQVSNLQVAELLASIVENPDVSVNKIVEAIAETTAPLRPIKELLEEISAKEISSAELRSLKTTKPAKADIDLKEQGEEKLAKNNRAAVLREREEKRIQGEKLAEEKRAQAQKEKEEKRIQAEREEKRIQAEREEKRIQAEREEKEKQRLQALRKKYEEEIEAAREKQEAAKSAAAAALAEKAELEKRAAEIQAKAEAAALAASQAKAVEAAVLAAARKGIVISNQEKEKIMESVRLARLPKEAALEEQPKPSLKKKPAFSFLGRAAPFFTTTETSTETEPATEIAEEKDAESKSKIKAEKKTIADKKQEEDKVKKELDAKKLAEAKKKEEQERLENEAKELKEKEIEKAKQKEAEAKRKEEELAEAKKKEEEEKTKKEVEAKQKEEEEKAKKEAEAKRQEEELAEAKKREEEKTKKEVEAKKKEEEEIAKKEAEAKRKEEELAEAKKKEEEETVKKEAEAKIKEKELAEAKRKEEELAEAKKAEEEKVKKEAEMLQAQEEEKVKALAEEEAAKLAAISAAANEKAEEERKDAESLAPGRKGFRWFWEPVEPETPDVEESTKEVVADVPVEAQIADQLPPCPMPLSPYARYPGLKPPAPPIASPTARTPEKVAPPKVDPVSSKIKGVDQATAKVELPSQEEPDAITEARSEDSQDDIEERARKIEEIAAREREALEKAQAAISFKWPWQSLETTVEESTSALKEEEPVVPQKTVSPTIPSQEKTETLPPSSRPLSPYAQYPGLKPPSPPKASAAPHNSPATNSKPAETLASSSSKLSPYPGFPDLKPPTSPAPGGNGAMPAQEAKGEEKAPEPAPEFGFKWPWQQ